MKNELCGLQEQSYLFCYLEFKHEELFMHRAPEVSFFAKRITFLTSRTLVVLLELSFAAVILLI